jgi:transcriptional regulator GlxA family with amidase domain
MESATPFPETATFGRPPSTERALAVLLADAFEQLTPEQTSAKAKLATAIQMVGGQPAALARSGGLAPWQANRLMTHLEKNLDARLRLEDAAALIRISASHCSRAFKKTFRQPFSQYVMMLRLERARVLLTTTDRPISEVALACGLADQAHLTRLFHRQYGAPPRAWRRAHGRAASLSDGAPT